MNLNREKNNNFLSKILHQIKGWPIEKKRTFSLSLALFFTILIIILNSAFNLVWKDDVKKINYVQDNAISSMKKSFSEILNTTKPAIDRIFSSSSQVSEIVDQINSTSSSFSTSANVVQ